MAVYDAVAGMQKSGYVQDVRYDAVAGMQKSGYVQDVRTAIAPGNCSAFPPSMAVYDAVAEMQKSVDVRTATTPVKDRVANFSKSYHRCHRQSFASAT